MTDPSWRDQNERPRATDTEEDVRVVPATTDPTDGTRATDEVVRERDTAVVTRSDRRANADRLGGIRWGAVFFGWLCATGLAVILVAVLAATGTAIGLTASEAGTVVDNAVGNAETISLAGAIALVVVLAISYLAGGYVAARMARFSGRSQGVAVWFLGLLITVVVALGGVLLGSRYDVLARLDMPRIPVDEGTATTSGIITLVAIVAVTLLAAILGGNLGDRYHRRIDEIDLR